jgi:hypothetical protein
VDVKVDSNGGLVERRENVGVVAERNPAIHSVMTYLLNPFLWGCSNCGMLLYTLGDLISVFGVHFIRLTLALVKFAADVGEVGRNRCRAPPSLKIDLVYQRIIVSLWIALTGTPGKGCSTFFF